MGRLTATIGGRLPLGIGSAIVACGFALLTRVHDGKIDYWTDLLPATLALGIGMGICVAPLTTTVMASVDTDHIGAASGFNSAVARIAGLVATALLGLVFALQGGAVGFVQGFQAAAMVGAVAAGAASACALLLIGGQTRVSPLPNPVE